MTRLHFREVLTNTLGLAFIDNEAAPVLLYVQLHCNGECAGTALAFPLLVRPSAQLIKLKRPPIAWRYQGGMRQVRVPGPGDSRAYGVSGELPFLQKLLAKLPHESAGQGAGETACGSPVSVEAGVEEEKRGHSS